MQHTEKTKLITTPGKSVAALTRWYKEGCKFGVVDIRDETAFRSAHVVESTSLPWGASGEKFWARLHELPPRGKSFGNGRLHASFISI